LTEVSDKAFIELNRNIGIEY